MVPEIKPHPLQLAQDILRAVGLDPNLVAGFQLTAEVGEKMRLTVHAVVPLDASLEHKEQTYKLVPLEEEEEGDSNG